MLAHGAREEQGGTVAASKASATSVVGDSAMRASLTAYDHEDTNDASERSKEDEEAHKLHDQMRAEKRHEGNRSCVRTT